MSAPNNVFGMTPRKASGGQARTPGAQGAINTIAASFDRLIEEDVRGYWSDEGEVKRQAISYGPYNQIIYRAPDGTAVHACGNHIPEMRDIRDFTRNAVELSCPALGLAVYVSGVTQVETNGGIKRLRKYLRLATYEYLKKTPKLSAAKDADELYSKLHGVLITTYNQLARDFNIAGLTGKDLTLVSDHPMLIPNVAINEPS